MSKQRVTRKRQFPLKKWVADYSLPEIEDALTSGKANKIKNAMLREFAAIAEESFIEHGHLHLLTEVGCVRFSLSESWLTPNYIAFECSLHDMVSDLMDWLGREEIDNDPGDFEPDNIAELSQWRDAFADAAARIDALIKKCDHAKHAEYVNAENASHSK